MSNKELARRTKAEVCFGGVDITKSIQPYLLSLSYTDNEEDATDDLQIKLQDRDDIWLCKWLNTVVQAAASSSSSSASAAQYKVTAKSGLNVRSGPGTNYSKLGSLAYGALLDVSDISNGWAAITYSGKAAYVSADYIEAGESTESAGSTGTVKGLNISAVFVRENWNGDGKDKILDCGQHELDSVGASGPPSVISIKGTSLPYSGQIRQTKKSRAWEAYTLSGIANEMASRGGMTCLYESESDPYYPRVEQITTSDIQFLSTLCHNAGISLKVTNNILVLFDQAAYEAKDAVATVKRGDGTYTKWNLSTGSADTKYASCRVSYTDPATGKCIEGIAYAEDYDAGDDKNQQLEISAKVSSISDAETLAGKRLRLHNKYENAVSFSLYGNPDIMAGVTVMLEEWGMWDGKYIVSQAKHSVDGTAGYTTQVKLRKVLEGY